MNISPTGYPLQSCETAQAGNNDKININKTHAGNAASCFVFKKSWQMMFMEFFDPPSIGDLTTQK